MPRLVSGALALLLLLLLTPQGTAAPRPDPAEALATCVRVGLLDPAPPDAEYRNYDLAITLERLARLPSIAHRLDPRDLSLEGFAPFDVPVGHPAAAAARAAVRRGWMIQPNGYFQGRSAHPDVRNSLRHVLASLDRPPLDPEATAWSGGSVRQYAARLLVQVLEVLGEDTTRRLVDPSPPPLPPGTQPPRTQAQEDAYRQDFQRAVERYARAAAPPPATVAWLARRHDRARGQVADQLQAAIAERNAQTRGWLRTSPRAPRPPPPPRPLAVPPGEPARIQLVRDGSTLIQVPGASGAFLGRDEVTVRQYQKFLASFPDQPRPSNWSAQEAHPDHPVVGLTRDEAALYAAWAGARLPSKHEWGLAAGGPEGHPYPWGAGLPPGTPPEREWVERYRARLLAIAPGWLGEDQDFAEWASRPGYQISWLVQNRVITPPTNQEWFGVGDVPLVELGGGPGRLFEAHPDQAALRPVGSFPLDVTPAGFRDMAGNAREWTANTSDGFPIAMGGTVGYNPGEWGGFSDWELPQEARRPTLGLRLARDP